MRRKTKQHTEQQDRVLSTRVMSEGSRGIDTASRQAAQPSRSEEGRVGNDFLGMRGKPGAAGTDNTRIIHRRPLRIMPHPFSLALTTIYTRMNHLGFLHWVLGVGGAGVRTTEYAFHGSGDLFPA